MPQKPDLFSVNADFDRIISRITSNKDMTLSEFNNIQKKIQRIQKKLILAKKEYDKISLHMRNINQMMNAMKERLV